MVIVVVFIVSCQCASRYADYTDHTDNLKRLLEVLVIITTIICNQCMRAIFRYSTRRPLPSLYFTVATAAIVKTKGIACLIGRRFSKPRRQMLNPCCRIPFLETTNKRVWRVRLWLPFRGRQNMKPARHLKRQIEAIRKWPIASCKLQ